MEKTNQNIGEKMYDLLRANNAGSAALVGMCKNAGKTTVLTSLIEAFYHKNHTLALTSIGRDGESIDVMTGTKKPRIYINKGTYFATASSCLRRCTATAKVERATGLQTSLGQVVILQALSDGYVELAGPAVLSDLQVIKSFAKESGAFFLLDGAISRKSPAGAGIADSVVLCTGASYSISMEKTVSDTAFWVKMFDLPLLDGGDNPATSDQGDKIDGLKQLLTDSNCVLIRGALTEGMLRGVLSLGGLSGKTIAIEDCSRLIAGRELLERFFARGGRVKVVNKTNLAFVTVNPFSAGGEGYHPKLFWQQMTQSVSVPVFDVMTGSAGGGKNGF